MPAFADHADAVAEAIVDWSRSPVTVVGHSLGAEVVVELARRHPSLVQRAVLIGPTGDPSAGGVFGVWKRWMSCAVSEPLPFNLLTLTELARIGPLRMAALLRRSFQDPVEAKLPELRCPTVLVRGERDRVAPAAWLDRMGRRIPDARIVTVAGSSHTLVYTDPRTLAELVMERFSRLPSQRLDGAIGVVPGEEPGSGSGSVLGRGDMDERRQDGAERLARGPEDR